MSLFFKDRHFLPLSRRLLTCLCLPITMMGQAVSTGNLTGSVTDPSHAAIPGAKVTLTETATGVTQATVTNDTGRYISRACSRPTTTLRSRRKALGR